MTNQYKILALDLDGTLLDAQSRITPENARAVRMAQQAGVQIVLCTGRNVREVRRFSEQLEAAPDWLVTETARQCSIRTTGNRRFSTA
ncbi:MAG: HAD hydrolase family protein [Butyricicoccus sp.]